MSKILKDRLAKLRDEGGFSNFSLATTLGFGKTYIDDFMTGRTASLSAKRLDKLAEHFGVTSAWLTGKTENRDGKATPEPSRSLPVMGTAAGSVLGAVQLSDAPVNYFRPPPGLIDVRDAYALYVLGDSMEPQYSARDPIFVNPHQPVRAGDIVVVQEERDGSIYAWIKKLTVFTEDEIVTEQYNPAGEVRFQRRFVVAVHRVLPMAEVLGL
ncbi:MAG: S24 family peptidase [Pseudomonadota bacterium]